MKKNKWKIIIIVFVVITLISIILGSIYGYKSYKNKLYDKVFTNINKIYKESKKITDKDKYINSLYQFYITNNNNNKQNFKLYTYNNFVSDNKLEKLYVDNNEILTNLEKNLNKLEENKNKIIDNFTYKKFISIINKDEYYINKRINKLFFEETKKKIEQEYNENLNSYNELKDFINYLSTNRTKWENNNNIIIIDGDEYKNFIESKNKQFNININTKKKIVIKNKNIPIFMYHAVNDQTWGITSLFQKIKDFETEMKYLNDNGYKTIFLSDIKNHFDDKKVILLTFDDAYEDFYRIAYPIMKKYSIKSNLFVISDAGGEKYVTGEQIKELASSELVEIGSHTVSHPDLRSLNTTQLTKELKGSKDTLEKLINKEVKTFAYPMGYHNDKVVAETGKYYEYAVLMGGGVNYINTNTNYLRLKRVSMYRGASLEYFVKNVKSSD